VFLQSTASLPTGQVGEPDRSLRLGQPRPYAALPHDLVADRRLTATAVRLVAILLRYARNKASCWPSVATLAENLGRCPRTVRYSLRRLTDTGWIESRPDPNPTGRVIVLLWRVKAVTPRANLPYTQGNPRDNRCSPPLQPVVTDPLQPVASESKKQEKEEGSALAFGKTEAEKPMTPVELAALLDLDLPSTSPLRHIVEQKLKRALASPLGGSSPPSVAGITVSVRGWRPG